MSSEAPPARETRGAIAAQAQAQQDQLAQAAADKKAAQQANKRKKDRERRARIKQEKQREKQLEQEKQAAAAAGTGVRSTRAAASIIEGEDEEEEEEDEDDQDDSQDVNMNNSASDNNYNHHPNKRFKTEAGDVPSSSASPAPIGNTSSPSANSAFYPNPIPQHQGQGSGTGGGTTLPRNMSSLNQASSATNSPIRPYQVQGGQYLRTGNQTPQTRYPNVTPQGAGSYQQQVQGNRNFNPGGNQSGQNNAHPGSYNLNPNASTPNYGTSNAYQTPARSGMGPPSATPRNDEGDRDILGGSGVNLDSEQEALYGKRLVSQAAAENPGGRNRHGKDLIDHEHLAPIVSRISSRNGLQVDPAVLEYLSAAAYLRFRNLAESMISASRHRSWSSHQRPPPTFSTSDGAGDSEIPMYHEEVSSDPTKQLAALERIDRQKEEKAQLARQKRELAEVNALLDPNSASGDGSAGVGEETATAAASKAKKKPPSAKNMSEDLSRKLTNSTLAQMTGGAGVRSWMTGGGSAGMNAALGGSWKPKPMGAAEKKGSSLPAPKFAPQVKTGDSESSGLSESGPSKLLPSSNTSNSGTGTRAGAWGDVSTRLKAEEEEERKASMMVKMEDALFALEMERSAGAGKGSGARTLYRERAKPRDKPKPVVPSVSSSYHASGGAMGLGLGGSGGSLNTWQSSGR